MNFKVSRIKSDHPGFLQLIELLNAELWERNPDRQSEYVSLNILEPNTNAVLINDGNIPVACGAYRNLGDGAAEIKRMYVKETYRGKGLSKLVLSELEYWAKEAGLNKAVLETGKTHPEAISLYKKSGYQKIENYGSYIDLPNSICMAKQL